MLLICSRPMWYSWSGAKKPGDDPHAPQPEQSCRMKPRSRLLYYFPTLLDQVNTTATDAFHKTYPSATDMIALWKQFLKNIHPLVMLFFDWEIELIIVRVSKHPTSLTQGEQALVFSILFITTMSLSEEQCLSLLHEKRSQALARFQGVVEDCLIAADFVVTSDRFVLQAFMLYLACFYLKLTIAQHIVLTIF